MAVAYTAGNFIWEIFFLDIKFLNLLVVVECHEQQEKPMNGFWKKLEWKELC